MRPPRREFPLYLITGAVLGILAGLLVAWVLFPVRYVNTSPASLRTDYKDEYRILIAAAYASTGDLDRARVRLATLNDADPAATLQDQAARASGEMTQVLMALSEALRAAPQATLPPPSATPPPAQTESQPGATASAPPSATPSPTATETPLPLESATPGSSPTFAVTAAPSSTAAARFIDTPIPRPTRAPTATPGAPFALTSADVVCDPDKPAGLLQIFVRDSSNAPAAGIELILSWNGGENRFFTGLKPELGNGYADFRMTPGTVYTLRFASGGTSVTDLYAPTCTNNEGGEYLGGLKLNFRQP